VHIIEKSPVYSGLFHSLRVPHLFYHYFADVISREI